MFLLNKIFICCFISLILTACGFCSINHNEDIKNIEQKIGRLLSFKFRYKGEELLQITEDYLKKEVAFNNDDLIKALEFHKNNQKDTPSTKSIRIPIRLYKNLSIENSLLGAAGYPVEHTVDSLVFERVFNINSQTYYKIDKKSPDIFDQKYRVYEKYKYPEVFYLQEAISHNTLNESICVKHPYLILRDNMGEQSLETNDDRPFKEYYFNVYNFVDQNAVADYLNTPYKEPLEATDIQRYFDVIKYIDPAYFSKVQDFKNDPFYTMKHHSPYDCKDCIPHGFVFDNLSEMGSSKERGNYLKEYGPYFPAELPRDITEAEFLAYVKGKNPNFPS